MFYIDGSEFYLQDDEQALMSQEIADKLNGHDSVEESLAKLNDLKDIKVGGVCCYYFIAV